MAGEWMSVKEAAAELGLSPGVVYRMAADGSIACYKVGPSRGRIRFKPEDISAYLEGCRVGGPRPVAPPKPARKPYVSKYDHDRPGSPLRKP